MMSVAQLCRVLEASAIARVYDDTELRAAIGRSPRRGGTRALREALALGHHLSPQQTRSMLEERFLTLVRESEPPIELPRLNSWIALPDGSGVEVDALWTSGLAIELDGERYHQHAGARARDASKQEALTALGYRVMRLTWRDVTATPVITLARVRRAIR